MQAAAARPAAYATFTSDRIAHLVGVDEHDAAGRENSQIDEFVAADLDRPLPFDPDSFDLVYANFVEHLNDPGAFEEWRRVLRSDGRLVLVTSNRASPFMALGEKLPQRARLAIKRRGWRCRA